MSYYFKVQKTVLAASTCLAVASPANAAPSLDISFKSWPHKVGNYPISECVVEATMVNHTGQSAYIVLNAEFTDRNGTTIVINRTVPDSKTHMFPFGNITSLKDGEKESRRRSIYLSHSNLPNCEAISGWKLVNVERCQANGSDANPESCLRLFKTTSGILNTRNLPDFPSPAPTPAAVPTKNSDKSKPASKAKPLGGWYNCYTMGYQMLWNGRVALHADGRYENPQGNKGRYRLDGDRVSFESGAFREWGWEGIYQKEKSTVVIKPIANPAPPGKEGFGKYQYCYHE